MTLRAYLTCYDPRFVGSLVYMLQSSEYDLSEYFAWFARAGDLRHVARRGRLVPTPKARLLLMTGWLILAVIIAAFLGAVLTALGQPVWWLMAAFLLSAAPLFLLAGLALPLYAGEQLIQKPRTRRTVAHSAQILRAHPGYRIAIAGSYGKTTFKENLAAILAEGKRVAATPGNMNTPLGISRFAQDLRGDEDVLIFELGEYYPGDIAGLCELVRPQLGVITGVNEAHLSKFKTLERTTAAIFELADYLKTGPVYKNGDNQQVRARAHTGDPLVYTSGGVNGWKVTHAQVNANSTAFTARKGRTAIHATTALLGRQQIGPLVAAIDIAGGLGLTPAQITAGIARTRPYDHRLQPRELGGAWVIDDTYNGNVDGVRAGLAWLAEVPAARRIYVTPGLVELGSRTAAVHRDIGRHVAAAADVVVLMNNSVTAYIQEGLTAAGFSGELKIVDDPEHFYANLTHFVAAGDVVLMQNDWTDNYA